MSYALVSEVCGTSLPHPDVNLTQLGLVRF
jgi:hypothetical protein